MKNFKKILKKNPNKGYIIFLLIVVVGYSLFFTSKLYLKKPLSPATEIAKVHLSMDNRSLTVIDAEYDKDKQLLEVQLDLDNDSDDNIDDYYFIPSISNGDSKKLQVTEVINNPVYTVLRINNLKSNFRELNLFIAPKIKKASEISTGEFIELTFNKNNIKYEKITNKNETDYLNKKYDVLISQKQKEIKQIDDEIKKQENELESFQKTKITFEKNKTTLTEEERQKYENKIKKNDEKEIKIKAEIDEKKEQRNLLEQEIDSYKSKIKK